MWIELWKTSTCLLEDLETFLDVSHCERLVELARELRGRHHSCRAL